MSWTNLDLHTWIKLNEAVIRQIIMENTFETDFNSQTAKMHCFRFPNEKTRYFCLPRTGQARPKLVTSHYSCFCSPQFRNLDGKNVVWSSTTLSLPTLRCQSLVPFFQFPKRLAGSDNSSLVLPEAEMSSFSFFLAHKTAERNSEVNFCNPRKLRLIQFTCFLSCEIPTLCDDKSAILSTKRSANNRF